MLRFGGGLVWILAIAVIAVGVLVYVGLFGPAWQEAPLEVLGSRNTSETNSASTAGASPRERQPAISRENRDLRAVHRRLDRGVDAAVRQPIHHEEESFLTADESIEAQGGTPTDTPALYQGASSVEIPFAEVAEGGGQNVAVRVVRDTFLRAVPQSIGRDAESPDDWAARERPWRQDDTPNQGWGIERSRGRAENGDHGTDGISDTLFKRVSVGAPVMKTCANEPWICNAFSLASLLPDTIPAVSNGTEAIQFLVAGGPDIVWVRTKSGVIEVSTENLTDSDQLGALIDQLVLPR